MTSEITLNIINDNLPKVLLGTVQFAQVPVPNHIGVVSMKFESGNSVQRLAL